MPKEVGKVGNEDPSFILPVSQRKDGIEAMFKRQAMKPASGGTKSASPSKSAVVASKTKAEAIDISDDDEGGHPLSSTPSSSQQTSSQRSATSKTKTSESPAKKRKMSDAPNTERSPNKKAKKACAYPCYCPTTTPCLTSNE